MNPGFLLIALICIADDPTTCARMAMGWAQTERMCIEMGRVLRKHPPENLVVKQTACESGRGPV